MIWKPNVTVAAIVERDGRFLLVEEQADGAVVLNQPAGHLDEGETLIDAVIRETIEETAWHIEPTALLGVYRWPHPAKPLTYLRFAFIARALREDTGRTLDKDILRALWLSADELRAERARHRSPLVERCLRDYLSGLRYPLDLLKDPC
ncbi:MAG: NUDIX hydrolase [Candidatus Muproteobacteria bacterium RBG_16_64_11]|uniref:Phosphatase NudJ n=1 Tax=Candidatus Muproteobacteria bacterium RBG_16_64_11 TaxID=1817758 RepID=A0A1F6TF96_9PROT|nr:MAG: NUDIX hydrolase [Candidatus Muproteobacteria bacterium RBG_16_64_11]